MLQAQVQPNSKYCIYLDFENLTNPINDSIQFVGDQFSTMRYVIDIKWDHQSSKLKINVEAKNIASDSYEQMRFTMYAGSQTNKYSKYQLKLNSQVISINAIPAFIDVAVELQWEDNRKQTYLNISLFNNDIEVSKATLEKSKTMKRYLKIFQHLN